MSPDRVRPAECVLGDRTLCPSECLRTGRCVVIRIRQKDSVEHLGVPLAVVGETLRFLQILPRPAVLLLPLAGLEPVSADLAVSCAPARTDDEEARAVRGSDRRGALRGER